MYHDDDDLHMCINCHATIFGLENYLSHRNAGPCKQQHPTKENEAPIPVLPPLGLQKTEHIRPVPSAPSTSSGDHLNFLNADFFFSSLELQSRRKDAVFEEVMGIEEVLEEEFEERESQGTVYVGGGKWGYEEYVHERDVWGGMEDKGGDIDGRGGRETAGVEDGIIIGVSKGGSKKGEGMSVDVGGERGGGGKRRVSSTSEVEENPVFVKSLTSPSELASVGSPVKQTTLPVIAREENGHGTLGNVKVGGVSEYSLGNCELGDDHSGYKEHDQRFEGNTTAPPRSHTRGKWVPGSASEGMRKSGNTVEYYCHTCNKSIRNRRSYETHLSTLCHLKKLMSTSDEKALTTSSEGPRLRSRRLQLAKSNSAAIKPPPDSCSQAKDENGLPSTGDANSQNYLLESLGIKRKDSINDVKHCDHNSCRTRKKNRDLGHEHQISSKNSATCENLSIKHLNPKKMKKIKNIKRAKHKKKRIQRIPPEERCVSHLASESEESGLKSVPVTTPIPNCSIPVASPAKSPRKSSSNSYSYNVFGEKIKTNRTYATEDCVDGKEGKFLPISDPHISHGYRYNSLESQQKQKKLRDNLDLAKQKCDNSIVRSPENLQEQMMLGLELMRTEHLLPSNEKPTCEEELKSFSPPECNNLQSNEAVESSKLSNLYITPKLQSFDQSHAVGNCNLILESNASKFGGEVCGEQMENRNAIEVNCDVSYSTELTFKSGTIPNTSVANVNGTDFINGNKSDNAVDESKVLNNEFHDKLMDTFNSSVLNDQSDRLVKTSGELNDSMKDIDVFKNKTLDTKPTNSLRNICVKNSILNGPNCSKNYFTLKVVKKGKHIINLSKRFSYDQISGLINSKSPEGDDLDTSGVSQTFNILEKKENNSLFTQGLSSSSSNISCSFRSLSELVAKHGSEILLVKKTNVKDIPPSQDGFAIRKGQIFKYDASKFNVCNEAHPNDADMGFKCTLDDLHGEPSNVNQSSFPSKMFDVDVIKCKNHLSTSKCLKLPMTASSMGGPALPYGSYGTHQGPDLGKLVSESIKQKSEDYNSKFHSCKDFNEVVEGSSCGTNFNEMQHASSNPSKDFNELNENAKNVVISGLNQNECKDFQVPKTSADRGHYSGLNSFMASDNPIEHEEVVDCSLPCDSSPQTVNIVISLDAGFGCPEKSCDSVMNKSGGLRNSLEVVDTLHYSDEVGAVPQHIPSPDKFISEKETISEPTSKKGIQLGERSVESVDDRKLASGGNGSEIMSLPTKISSAETTGVHSGQVIARHQDAEHKGVLYCCKLCDYKSPRHWCVERHTKKHFHRERSFCCHKCSLTFLTLDNLKQHMKRHRKKRWYCRFHKCSQAFATKQELVAHLSGLHAVERSYKCQHCDYSGKNILALMRHKKVHEESDSSVQCEVCSQICKRGSLARHMKIHGKHHLYHCPFCDLTSYYLSNIHRHMAQSDVHPERKLYNCPFCIVIENDPDECEQIEHSYCIANSPFSTNVLHEMMDHINSAHGEEKNYSYMHNSVSEIARRIHVLLRIIDLKDTEWS